MDREKITDIKNKLKLFKNNKWEKHPAS